MDDLRAQVLKRCKGYCEKCGLPLPEYFALHHRKLRSRGGENTVENLIALHHKCHNLGTDSVHLNVKTATDKGYMVPSWANPQEFPMQLVSGDYVLLAQDGTYQPITKGTER